MSMVDFAAWRGNSYLPALGFDVRSRYFNVSNLGMKQLPTLEAAMQALRRPDMLVLFTEELSAGVLTLWHGINERGKVPQLSVSNTLASRGRGEEKPADKPDEEQLLALRHILAADVYLYGLARNLSCRPSTVTP